ncbi:MAG: type II secretion system F family protein, partial [Eubacteriales bacterium]|nr:type II secretion system F family protein [Eubacteriales bacterium]
YLIKVKNIEENRNLDTTYRISKNNLYVICRQYSSMLSSGINSVKCLEILYNQTENKKIKEVLSEVYEQLQTGKNLSEAMQSLGGVFPEFMINMIKAGEMSGNLAEAIKRLAIQYEKDIKIRNKIASAMVYPVFLLIATIASILVMFGFVLPKIMEVIGSPDDLNIFSKFLFSFSTFLRENWLVTIMVLLIFLIMFLFYSKTEDFKYKFAKMKVKMPLIGKLYITMITGIFTRTLSTLFLSGTTLITSIEMAGDVINNKYISKILKEVIDDIEKGMTFSDSLIKSGIFPNNITSMISVGEETGSLDDILMQTSDYYDMIAEDSIQKMTSIIEPIMIIIFGIIVLIILAGAFLPIY